MGELIGVIGLCPGVYYWSDPEYTHIVLSKLNKTAKVYDNYNLSNVVEGLREGLIKLISGEIPYEDECEDDRYRYPNEYFDPMPWFMGLNDATTGMDKPFDPMEGVVAMNNYGENLTDLVEIGGSVNTSVPGKYELTYSVTDRRGNNRKQKRYVTVLDNIPPELTGIEDKEIYIGSKFDPLEGVVANDNVYGTEVTRLITYKVKDSLGNEVEEVDTSENGLFTIEYAARDYHNNFTYKSRTISVVMEDTEPPVIQGLKDVSININEEFDPMEGISAVDDVDGDVTDKITVAVSDYTIPEIAREDIAPEDRD